MTWYASTPSGPYSSVTVTDTLGVGLVADCSNLIDAAYVRSWAQAANYSGSSRDAWAASLSASDYTISNCTGSTFTITFNYDVPANSTDGADKAYYIGFTYRTHASDGSMSAGQTSWTNNVTTQTSTGATSDKSATATFNASGTGKRKVFVEKILSGDTTTYAQTTFPVALHCDLNGTGVVDTVLSLKSGVTNAQYALVPLGVSCSVDESSADAQGATVAYTDASGATVSTSQPLSVDAASQGQLQITVTNTFQLGTVTWDKKMMPVLRWPVRGGR